MSSAGRASPSALLLALFAASAGCRGEARTEGAPQGATGCDKHVLIVVDEAPDGAAPLALALAAAGWEVTTSSATSSDLRALPARSGGGAFGALVLLGGAMRVPPVDMPAEGQRAIADHVARGRGLVLTEWAAFHVKAEPQPRWQTLAPLMLLERSESIGGRLTFEVDPAFASHPIWAGLPPSFTFTSTSSVGAVIAGPDVKRLAQSPEARDVVAIRELPPSGRVVHIAHAGNHVAGGWSNVNVQRLMVNAVAWAAHCEGG